MTLRVIGAGFGRTGTMSLKAALETLTGAPCYHMAEAIARPAHLELWRAAVRRQPVDWELLFDGFETAVDWPTCTFWRELGALYPDAKVLLSWRDPESWHRSVCNTIYHPMTMEVPPGAPPHFADFQKMTEELILEGTFQGKILDYDHATRVFEEHNAAVRAEVPAELLIDYEVGSGWEPLCKALGVPVPDEPFPKTNTTDEYRERLGLPAATT